MGPTIEVRGGHGKCAQKLKSQHKSGNGQNKWGMQT